MVICSRCGASNQAPGKFCATCGAPLAAQAPQGAPPGWGQPAPQPSPYGPPPAANPAPPFPAPPAGPPGWGPAQPYQPPGQGGGYAAPPGWGSPAPTPAQPQRAPDPGFPPQQQPGGYQPAAPNERHRVGTPEGLNPFGATVGPEYGAPPQQQYPNEYGAPPQHYAPPPPQQPAQPPAAHGSSPGMSSPSNAGIPAAAASLGETRVSAAPPPRVTARDPEHVEPDAARVLAGFLIHYDDTPEASLGRFWPVYQGRNVIGRKDAAPGLDVEIDNATTSSRHAVIFASARPSRMKLEDPGSTNGTFVNEQKLAFGSKHELADGDSIRFGGYTVIVKII